MRSLWTAASGMKSQQFNIDTISHNLANVNTTAFKSNRAEFKDLFYTNLKRANIANGERRPVSLEVGHGSMPIASRRDFMNGSFMHTEGVYDVALNGEGFFAVRTPRGDTKYTRDGSFKVSLNGEVASLVTSEGYQLLSGNGEPVSFNANLRDITIDSFGNITGINENGDMVEAGQIGLFNFLNPEGLDSEGGSLYSETTSSGAAEFMAENERRTEMAQGYLEASNVQIVDEMVKMITAQRAYEINSKSITTSDEMMQIANNLKR